MSGNPTVEELLQRNAQKARSHRPIPTLSEISQQPHGQQMSMPKIFIVACCDNRLDPFQILGLEKWDAVVVRSCAGRIAPQMQNLVFLDHVLQFSDVMIIHHTDCSAELFKNDHVRETLKERAPAHNNAIDELEFPGFDDLEQSVRDDVALVHKSPLLRKELAERTHGFVYDITTGKVTLVV
ncbi:hypothetical protein V494_07353 [Pseudogymnoascus sp. VKM F-4513 (FW-928)]|nr:hypothetical protein V494_07353 [Pseudogymnoascus sp. VKM F-4513 (FW-928)]